MGPFAIIGIIAVAIFSVVMAMYRAEKKRTESMRLLAEELSLSFYPKDLGGIGGSMRPLPLFAKGRSRKFTNIIHGQTDDLALSMFGYRFTTGHGKNSSTQAQTVISFQSPKLDLPEFCLAPENLFHRMAEKMGYQDIDFDSHPKFSRQYLLRGNSEPQIRQCFTPALLEHLETLKGVTIEASGNQLIYYRARKRVSADSLQSLMTEAFQVYRLFCAGMSAA